MTEQVFKAERRVRFADCDAAGIVFFPRYFEMLNGVVEDWFAGPLQASFRELHLNRQVSVPTAAVEARFIVPSGLEDRLTFALTVTKLGGASCGLRHRIRAGDQLRFEATQTIVHVGASLKPEPWPDGLARPHRALPGGLTMNRVLLPEGWPRPRGYSNGIEATGRTVFVAGQIGWTPDGVFVEMGFVGQFRQVIKNTLAVLAEAGAGPENIVRMTWYVVDKSEYLAALGDIGAVWRELIGPHYPAMAVVEVKGLVEDTARIEIETTAVVGQSNRSPS